jgi:hypothetical protein
METLVPPISMPWRLQQLRGLPSLTRFNLPALPHFTRSNSSSNNNNNNSPILM